MAKPTEVSRQTLRRSAYGRVACIRRQLQRYARILGVSRHVQWNCYSPSGFFLTVPREVQPGSGGGSGGGPGGEFRGRAYRISVRALSHRAISVGIDAEAMRVEAEEHNTVFECVGQCLRELAEVLDQAGVELQAA
jgi:hypothetical protein